LDQYSQDEQSVGKANNFYGEISINIVELDTSRQGVLVSVSKSHFPDEASSNTENMPDWQFEVEPNATPFVFEQSHIIVSEQTESLVFFFHSYEEREFIGSVEVSLDELIKHGL